MPVKLFQGLSAFPLTPVTADGQINKDRLAQMLERLVTAGVDSIGLLGSTGIYAYLSAGERSQVLAAAVEAINGRVPLVVGVGAMRTDWAQQFARDAEKAGADGLLLAPVSYTPLTADEVALHFEAVAGATALPLCVYNNPGTTHFTFTQELLARISALKNVAAVKMPALADGDFTGEIGRLQSVCTPDFAIGYSGDWYAAPALLAGAASWYSVVAGLLPVPALQLTKAAQSGDKDATAAWDDAFAPLWALFRQYSSLRVMYAIAEELGLPAGLPPAPLKPIPSAARNAVAQALEGLRKV